MAPNKPGLANESFFYFITLFLTDRTNTISYLLAMKSLHFWLGGAGRVKQPV
jgi:hypothetical protein